MDTSWRDGGMALWACGRVDRGRQIWRCVLRVGRWRERFGCVKNVGSVTWMQRTGRWMVLCVMIGNDVYLCAKRKRFCGLLGLWDVASCLIYDGCGCVKGDDGRNTADMAENSGSCGRPVERAGAKRACNPHSRVLAMKNTG